MYRSLSRIRFSSIADFGARNSSSLLENKRKKFSDCLESARTFTSTIGHKYIGYGGESYKSSMQFQIVNALRFGERAKASRLLSDLGNGNYSIRANDFVHILDCCGQSPDKLVWVKYFLFFEKILYTAFVVKSSYCPFCHISSGKSGKHLACNSSPCIGSYDQFLFVMETLKLAREKEISLDNRCYKLIIKSLCLGGYLEERRALGAEGMVEELIHYLRVAENHFNHGKCYLATPIYNTVLHSLIEENETHMAVDVFKAMKYFGFRPDDRDGYCLQSSTCTALAQGRIDVIELIAEQMLQKKIQPDSSTCNYIFSAYVDCGFQSTAIEELQVLSMLMISQEDVNLQEKGKIFEEFILAEDSEAELQIFEFFKGYEESLIFALLSLRWCAMVGSSISWSPDQSPKAFKKSQN
ncbi:hypothetical protein RJ641_032580 [Dillenia turbinata]|uniref:Pentatricopeptide repeat-containing protein n=1 Tax=Dillenia turbinata TaxID=194707 RepID=A0AAN8W4L1_9MAGN